MKKVTFQIDGMHCAGCVNAVDKQLEALEGVQSAQVNLATESATVEYDGEISMETFDKAVTRAGFTLVRQESEETEDKARQAEEREQKKLDSARRNMIWSWIPTAVMLAWMLPMWIADYMF